MQMPTKDFTIITESGKGRSSHTQLEWSATSAALPASRGSNYARGGYRRCRQWLYRRIGGVVAECNAKRKEHLP